MWAGCVIALVVGAGVLIDDIKKNKKIKYKKGKEKNENKKKK